MKNIILIDSTSGCTCDLVSSENDGTNSIYLEIISDVSMNPKLILNYETVNIAESKFLYKIPDEKIVASTNITFHIDDDSNMGDAFTISFPVNISGNMTVRQVDNFNYEICSKNSDSNIFLAAHPVGAIYMSVDDVNPGNIYGGTWVQWGEGKVPVGVNSSDADFKTVEKTGGKKNITLTVKNMPSHKHEPSLSGYTFAMQTPFSTDSIARRRVSVPSTGNIYAITANISASDSVGTDDLREGTETASTGSGEAHSNLQPYITCYMWKRTA